MKEINLGFWTDLRNRIRNHLANENISSFQSWIEIRNTMISGGYNVEYEYLINDKRWILWKDKLKETVLKPNSHVIYSESSTNNLHHAYSLQILMEETGVLLSEFGTVVEFGGGYGNVCRLFKIWGHNKSYYLYDIPELLKIQQYYLKENKIINNVHYIQDFDVVNTIEGNSLFIGMWSITESPIGEREEFLENLGFYKCNSIFLAFHEGDKSNDNLAWLKNTVIPKLEIFGYNCKIIKINHLPANQYFVAIKNVK